MAVSVTYNFGATVRETLETGIAGADQPIVPFDAYNVSGRLNGTTTTPVDRNSQFLLTLAAGVATINLAALVGANGAIDLTGKKVQLIRITNLGANAMTFSKGASNGYELNAGGAWSHVVSPGCTWQEIFNEAAQDVAAGARTIDVAGTLVQTAEITIIAG